MSTDNGSVLPDGANNATTETTPTTIEVIDTTESNSSESVTTPTTIRVTDTTSTTNNNMEDYQQEVMTTTNADPEALMANMIAIHQAVGSTIEEIEAHMALVSTIPPATATAIATETTTGIATATATGMATATAADITDITTGLPLPLHDAQVIEEPRKRGGRCCRCFCDFRNAALTMNIIYPICFLWTFVRWWSTTETSFFYGGSDVLAKFFARHMIFAALASGTALIAVFFPQDKRTDRKWSIPLHLCAMTMNLFAYLIEFAELQRSLYDDEQLRDDDDKYVWDYNALLAIGPPYNYYFSIGFWFLSFYPNACFMIESYRGYWDTPEDFARERTC